MALTPEQAEARKPGIYQSVPATEYHSWPGASASRLKVLADTCPATYRHRLLHPPEPTPDMLLGTAMHAAVLEPERFAAEWVTATKCIARTKGGTECDNAGKWLTTDGWLCGVHCKGSPPNLMQAPANVMTADDYARVIRMRDAVLAHPMARNLLDRAESREVSLVWADKETGLPCRMRADILAAGIGAAGDLKKVGGNASRREFTRAIGKYYYHLQAAFYLEGFAACGVACDDFAFIAVEDELPHNVAFYRLEDDVVEFGAKLVRRHMRTLADCLERERKMEEKHRELIHAGKVVGPFDPAAAWPGYGDGVQAIGLSEWAMRDED